MPAGPDTAFCFAMLGTLLVYVEFVRPGRVIPGIFGLVLLIYGAYRISQSSPARTGVLLIGSAAVLFVSDALVDSRSALGITGTIVLTAGSLRLFQGMPRITPAIGIGCSVLLGALTIYLAFIARKARRNKLSDLA